MVTFISGNRGAAEFAASRFPLPSILAQSWQPAVMALLVDLV